MVFVKKNYFKTAKEFLHVVLSLCLFLFSVLNFLKLLAKDTAVPFRSASAFLSLVGTQSGRFSEKLSSGFCTPKRGITKFG
jgi:hypothetical protein